MKNEVNERSGSLKNSYYSREDLRHIRQGTKAMKAAGTKYLPQHPGEPDEQYTSRLQSSVLHNITARIIDVLTARPFKKIAFIQSKNPEISKLNINFDGSGQSFTDSLRLYFQEALWDSQAHVFVDFSKSKKDPTGAPIYTPNSKHRVKLINNDNILNGRYDKETGELTYLRFRDYICVQEGFNDKEVLQIWEFKKEFGEVFFRKHIEHKMENETVFEPDPWDKFSLKFIPFLSLYPKPTKVKFNPKLIFQDMAELNITHWQSYSEQRNALKFARIPILFFKGVDLSTKDGGIKLGSQYAVATKHVEADGKYIETAGTAIKDGRDDVLDLEQKMQALGFELLAKKQGAQTATGATYDMESTNSLLGCFAVALKEFSENLIKIICAWYNINDDFEVNLDTKFNIDYNDEKIRTLLAIWTNGGIKTDSFLIEMKKHGVIHEEADIDTIIGIAGLNEKF